MDLVTANYDANTLTVLTNNGRGGFALAGTLNVGQNPYSVVAANVKGYGKIDLICGKANGPTLSVFTNNGLGGFELAATPGVGGSWVTAADLNGDGKADIICPVGYNTVSVFINTSYEPHAARATATLVNGFVVKATIEDAGYGYTNTPNIYIMGGGGSGAQATATVSNGNVTAISILDAGFGYTSSPLSSSGRLS